MVYFISCKDPLQEFFFFFFIFKDSDLFKMNNFNTEDDL